MGTAVNLDDIVRAFDRDGFVSIGAVRTASEARALAEEYEGFRERMADGRGVSGLTYANLSDRDGQNHRCLAGLFKVSEGFRSLSADPRIHEIVARLIGTSTVQLWVDAVHDKPGGSGAALSWHQDAAYHKPVEPAFRMPTVWMALDDVDEETGCMWMVPGSHKWGLREPYLRRFSGAAVADDFRRIHAEERIIGSSGPWRPAVPRRASAGEVLIHHSLMWHGSSVNLSARPRRAYSMFVMPDDTWVTGFPDARIPLPKGALMKDAGPEFPILYRAPS